VSIAFSFSLSKDFVATYKEKKAPFGYRDAGGNSVGEITFLRTYSRKKEDGTKETWAEVCERVTNGTYSLQKDYAKSQRLPWNDAKAQSSAKEFFDRLFNLKWTPPGRGLWVMGTSIVNVQKNSAALQNCAFVSTAEMTKNNPAKPFAFLMEASMLGVGVGFDQVGADKDFTIYEPQGEESYVIPDTREGWQESTVALINSFLKEGQKALVFDYSEIRPYGAPIATFGGTASGPDPLILLHNVIRKMFTGRAGGKLTRTDIADIGNLIGRCVVSGNVRRSAEILIGDNATHTMQKTQVGVGCQTTQSQLKLELTSTQSLMELSAMVSLALSGWIRLVSTEDWQTQSITKTGESQVTTLVQNSLSNHMKCVRSLKLTSTVTTHSKTTSEHSSLLTSTPRL
jgi:ribonucleoside-triphosphate reductase